KSEWRCDRNRNDWVPGARHSTRGRSSQRNPLYRSDELGGEDQFGEQTEAAAKGNAPRSETSTKSRSRDDALIRAPYNRLRSSGRRVGRVGRKNRTARAWSRRWSIDNRPTSG